MKKSFVRATSLALAAGALWVPAGCAGGGGGEEAGATESALTHHVLIVKAKRVGQTPSGNAAEPATDDPYDQETPVSGAAVDGALLRASRTLSDRGICLLRAGRYALSSAPVIPRAPYADFTFVTFHSAPTGIGGQPCGLSGWFETSAVTFDTVTSDDPQTPSRQPGSVPASGGGDDGASECGPDSSFRPSWIKPVAGPVTDTFGASRPGGRKHAGIDVGASTGTPLRAPERGRVVDVGYGRGACGTVLKIRHPNGSATRFCHNDKILVEEGECVSKGQVVAKVGNTGHGTGPHMHLEYYPSPTSSAVNPRSTFGY